MKGRLFSSTTLSTTSKEETVTKTTRRLYRILQRQCIEFSKSLPTDDTTSGETMFLYQRRLNQWDSGNHRCFPIRTASPDEDNTQQLLADFMDWNRDIDFDQGDDSDDLNSWYRMVQYGNDDNDNKDLDWDALDQYFSDEGTLWVTVSSIQKTIRYAFRSLSPTSSDTGKPLSLESRRLLNKFAIRAIRLLMEQRDIRRLSSVSYEKDIRVVATSRHIGSSHMGPRRAAVGTKHRFNYRMRIENLSDQETVQLLGRYWQIQDLSIPSEGGEAVEVGDPIIVDAPNSGAGKGMAVTAISRLT